MTAPAVLAPVELPVERVFFEVLVPDFEPLLGPLLGPLGRDSVVPVAPLAATDASSFARRV